MQLTEDYTDFSFTLRSCVILSFAQKKGKMLKTSKWDYENLSIVTYPFLFDKLIVHALNKPYAML